MNQKGSKHRYTELKKVEGKKLFLNDFDNVTYLRKEYPLSATEVLKKLRKLSLEMHEIPRFDSLSYNEEKDRLYSFEEYIPGDTFEDFLNTDFPLRQGIIYFRELLKIANKLNNENIIHKDLKPTNIIIDNREEIRVIDFNISRVYSPSKSKDTTAIGTVPYLAPEQYGFGQTTYKTDIYALGIILKEIIDNSREKSNGYLDRLSSKMSAFDPKDRLEYHDIFSSIDKILNVKKIPTAHSSFPFNTKNSSPIKKESSVKFISPIWEQEDVWIPYFEKNHSRKKLIAINIGYIGLLAFCFFLIFESITNPFPNIGRYKIPASLLLIYISSVSFKFFINLITKSKIWELFQEKLWQIFPREHPQNLGEYPGYLSKLGLKYLIFIPVRTFLFITSIILGMFSITILISIISSIK